MTSLNVIAESLIEQVRRGGVDGHRAFDELASIANGRPAIRPLFIALESEIASGAIALEPYPEVMPRTLLQSLIEFFPKVGNLPPDKY